MQTANDTIRLNLEAFASVPAITPIGSDRPVSETLPIAVRKIAEALHPHQIILFGSYAYGTPTPDSDVDLLVVMDSIESDKTAQYLSVSRLLAPRPFPVDILVQSPYALAQAITQGNRFYSEVMVQGKVLYEHR